MSRVLNEFGIYYARDILHKKVLTCTVRDENEASKALVKSISFHKVCSLKTRGEGLIIM
ncbi:hypothetical protein DSOL_5149 [Desulfosporosinus metallidurans]|uniref:N-acetyltransferase domain-containing protein n=1 Tax=Desulfosporosinus metallidurans TaxID=1888891 RepID=A0A1Q8QFC8_9FIRM|nr:hypothetical protein DSOL_5149 [Desulfosporosinus metallidurans]